MDHIIKNPSLIQCLPILSLEELITLLNNEYYISIIGKYCFDKLPSDIHLLDSSFDNKLLNLFDKNFKLFDSVIHNKIFIKRLFLLSLNSKSLYCFVIHNNLYLEDYFSFEEIIQYNLFFDKIKNDTFNKLYKKHKDILDKQVFHLKDTIEKDFVLAASINSSWFSNIYLNYNKLRHSLFDILKSNISLYSSEFLSFYLTDEQKKELYLLNPSKDFFYDLSFSQEEIKSLSFVEFLFYDLNLLSFYNIKSIQDNYYYIRQLILSNHNIGKQSLKYFLIKNKHQLDKELLEYSLNRFPRFINSLKIKDPYFISISKKRNPNLNKKNKIKPIKSKNLEELLFKKSEFLSLEEKEYIQFHIDIILNREFNLNYNLFTKELILKNIKYKH